jgi:ligand-binding SRPBCC domain-containing protein
VRRWLIIGLIGGTVAYVAGRRAANAILGGDKREPAPGARTYVLESQHAVKAPLAEVFLFFEAPENLAKLTPPSMGFRILRIENLPMRAGTQIEYEIRPFGVPQRWETEIVEYEPGRRFVDLQTRGPYRYWRHEHSFDEIDGVTVMNDRVEYQLPLGPIGRLANALVVRRELQRIFDYREQAIDEIFGG